MTYEPKSEFLRVIHERGFFHQATDLEALDAQAAKGTITGYIGFDATANSFHIGNLIQIMLLRWLQKTGHRPLPLVGGGTTKIGDPSGKDEVRKLLTNEDIQQNVDKLQQTFAKFIKFGTGPTDAFMTNNADWLDKLEYIPFLRDVGRHFTINRMLTFDSVRLRLDREQPLTFLEFNYMILQAYDFAELYKHHGCVLQMGGADQWGNIVSGVDLGRRIAQAELFGLTTPLLLNSEGKKMGKSVSGAVWLNEDRLSPYDYYQYWRNVEDTNIGQLLKWFTELPLDEIARLAALQGQEINEAKKVLALEATALCHGREAAEQAAATARETFEQGSSAAGLPTITLAASDLASGKSIADLAVAAGLAQSKGEARRLIKQGGLSLNDVGVKNEMQQATAADLQDSQLKLSAGKKRHVLVKIS
jgi:tyrosyl-tRNA synthetase